MAILVDSSVLIEAERRGFTLADVTMILGSDEPIAISSVTASEFLVGVHLAGRPVQRAHREEQVESLLERIPVVDFDLAAARTHAQLWAQLRREGNMIGTHDLLIAATALSAGYSILTENVREFSRIPGLEVRRPHW